MPQLNLAIYLPQIFWFAIFFSIFTALNYKIFLPKLRYIIDSRDSLNDVRGSKISQNNDAALQNKVKAKKIVEDAVLQSHSIIKNANIEAGNIASQTNTKIQDEFAKSLTSSSHNSLDPNQVAEAVISYLTSER